MSAPVCSVCGEPAVGPGTTRGDGICLCRLCCKAFYRSPEAAQARSVLVSLARVWAARVRGPRLQVVAGGES